MGVEKGIFAKALGPGVVLKAAIFNAGPAAVEALLSNSVDAVYVGPNPAINAFVRSKGEAVRIISGATSGGASLVVRASIHGPADLEGRKLASPGLGNTQDVALRWWLKQHGLRTDVQGGGDVSILPQDNAQTLQAFKAGLIDGAWLPEPWATRLVLEGRGQRLVDERDLWPGGQFATTVLVVRTDFLNQHVDTVKRLLAGQVQANDFINQHPAEAQLVTRQAIAAITGSKLSEQLVASAWPFLTFSDDPIGASFQVSADHAHELAFLPTVRLSGMFALGPLKRALAEAGEPPVEGL